MKVLNISQCDYANFQYDNMKALRSVGLECESVVLEKHPFYEEQSRVVDIFEMCRLISEADLIQFFHDSGSLFLHLHNVLKDKRVFAYHTSSVYRRDYIAINLGMRGYVEKHIACMPEFVAMCPGAIYMVGAVDTKKLHPVLRNPGPVRFAHYPSNPVVKGTAKIIEMMKTVDAHFRYTNDAITVSHKTQLGMMYECDVYIEMFTDTDGLGSVYGNFGITALEAAAMGKIVVTQCKNLHTYQKRYGNPFFISIENEHDFIKQIRFLNTPNVIETLVNTSRELLVKNHSYKATGEYFLNNVL